MLRMSLTARRAFRGRTATALAMALALAGGAVAGTAVTSAPAAAQQQPELKASKDFGKLYQPVAVVANGETGDFAAAKAQLPAIQAAVQTADDRYLAGNLTYVLGIKLKDRALQQQGMELMLASGKATAPAAAEMNYFLGEWAYDAQQWAKARQLLQAARAGGYTEGNAEGLTAESYFKEGQTDQGLAYLESLIQKHSAAGQTVPDAWVRRGLRVAYEAKNAAQIGKWSALLVEHNPTPENWQAALQVVGTAATEPQVELDLLRLMALTNSLKERGDFARYIEAADPRIMANEVAKVLDAGVQAGVFNSGDDYYSEVKRIVDERAPIDRREAPGLAAQARGASGTGRDAQNAGDVYLSLGSYAEAEEMYALALQKGGIDRDRILTRLGIAQVHQGKNAEAKATFGQVSGERTAVAQMWSAYVESRA